MSLTNPHFFKPVLPGFLHEFLIPNAFFINYLGGGDDHDHEPKSGVLRRSSSERVWPVKISGRHIESGWPEFAAEHELHVGDFVVFRHDGDLVFDVRVFDPSACERLYSPPVSDVHVEEEKEEEEEGHRYNQLIPMEESLDPVSDVHVEEEKEEEEGHQYNQLIPMEESLDVKPVGVEDFDVSKEVVKQSFPCRLEHPNCLIIVKHTTVKESRFYIPIKFARENGLCNKHCGMILKDQKGRSWPMKLRHKSGGKAYVGCGWRDFKIANGLKLGDSFTFELVENGVKLVANIYVHTHRIKQLKCPVTRAKSKQAVNAEEKSKSESVSHKAKLGRMEKEESLDAKPTENINVPKEVVKQQKAIVQPKAAATSFPCRLEHPGFVVIVKHSFVKESKFYIPIRFARENGLCNRQCGLILRDQKGRPWSVKLRHKSSGEVYVGCWRAFRIASGLNLGDSFTFELVENGEKLVANIYVHTHRIKQLKCPVKKAKSKQAVNPKAQSKSKSVSRKAKLGRMEKEESSDAKPLENINEESEEILNKKQVRIQPKSKITSPPEHPVFVGVVRTYGVTSAVRIPAKFGRENGLSNRCHEMILKDDKGRLWPVRLTHKTTREVYIGRGWREFQDAHGLKKGDRFIFELIKKGAMPIAIIHLRMSKAKPAKHQMPEPTPINAMAPKAKAAPPMSPYPYFVVRLTERCISRSQLNIPIKFARANGLCDKICKMTLRDQNGWPWPVTLRHAQGSRFVYIGSGWKEFALKNRLKGGDLAMLELIKKGRKLIMNFNVGTSRKLISANTIK